MAGWTARPTKVRLPNAWLLGPVMLAGVFAASGVTARMEPLALVLAQVLIGWSLGQHMTLAFFMASERQGFFSLLR